MRDLIATGTVAMVVSLAITACSSDSGSVKEPDCGPRAFRATLSVATSDGGNASSSDLAAVADDLRTILATGPFENPAVCVEGNRPLVGVDGNPSLEELSKTLISICPSGKCWT